MVRKVDVVVVKPHSAKQAFIMPDVSKPTGFSYKTAYSAGNFSDSPLQSLQEILIFVENFCLAGIGNVLKHIQTFLCLPWLEI